MTLWTQTLILRWRPELRFHEAKLAILRRLEDEGNLRSFRVADDEIGAVLPDGSAIEVSTTGLTTVTTSPETEREDLALLGRRVLDSLQPTVTQILVLLQHLVPIDGNDRSYVETCADSTVQTLGDLAQGLNMVDYALLVDGLGTEPTIQYQAEFGIVHRAQMPARLSRRIGRMSGAGLQQDVVWSDEGLPDIALFVDSTWQPRREDDIREIAKEPLLFWTDSVQEAESLVSRLAELAIPRHPEPPNG